MAHRGRSMGGEDRCYAGFSQQWSHRFGAAKSTKQHFAPCSSARSQRAGFEVLRYQVDDLAIQIVAAFFVDGQHNCSYNISEKLNLL